MENKIPRNQNQNPKPKPKTKTQNQNRNPKYNPMEIKDFQILLLAGVLLFCGILYLGFDELKRKEALGEPIQRSWNKMFENPFLEKETENFKEKKEPKKEPKEEKENLEVEILEVDEEEDKKNHKKREGAKDIFAGIKKAFTKVGDTIKKGVLKPIAGWFNKITKPIIYIFDSVECGVKKIESLFVCAKWYLLHLLGIILYFPYHILFYLVGFTRYENMLWKYIYQGDSIFFNLTGFHFAHYSDEVTNLCYNCCR
jgi:hypothetical protein